MIRSRCLSLFAGVLFAAGSAQAQLAITEVMSSASTNLGPARVTQNSDYWELSNLGTETINLQDYQFSDDGGITTASSTVFEGLTLGPGESAVFFRSDVNKTEEEVRAWWGESLPIGTKIRFYASPGFSSGGDMVQVWAPDDSLVDSVSFPEAVRGRSFTYNTNNGAFTALSTNGVAGAFKAVTADDEGSPGVHAGPVPLRFTLQPKDTTIPAGNSVTFSAAATGLPRAKYQWRKGTTDLPGETAATFTLANPQPADSGLYSVVVSNGLSFLASTNATLTVTDTPQAPVLTTLPKSLAAYVGQTPTFTVAAQGSPSPSFRWQLNGQDLNEGGVYSGVTEPTLVINSVDLPQAGIYTVRVFNSAGSTNASATLTVTPKPLLAITEVSSGQATNEAGSTLGHGDWWELTNLGDFPVDLRGYRFDDSTESLAAAYTITNEIFLQPGESLVLVEGMTDEAFRAWWGPENLPPGQRILGYSGGGLGLSGTSGDALNLWNAVATDKADKVAGVTFSAGTEGVSFVRDPESGIFWGNTTTGLATLGVNGAVAAAVNGDIGSPGTVIAPLRVASTWSNGELNLTWSSQAGRDYAVFVKPELFSGTWTAVTNLTATGSTTTATNVPAVSGNVFRVRVTLPPAQ